MSNSTQYLKIPSNSVLDEKEFEQGSKPVVQKILSEEEFKEKTKIKKSKKDLYWFLDNLKDFIIYNVWKGCIINTYDLFVYDIPYFIKNVWDFRKPLWEFRPWDFSHYNIILLIKSLELTGKYLSKCDYLAYKDKYVKEINDVITKLKNDLQQEEYYHPEAEKHLGIKMNKMDIQINEETDEIEFLIENKNGGRDKEIMDLSRKLEEQNWKKIWKIISKKSRMWWY